MVYTIPSKATQDVATAAMFSRECSAKYRFGSQKLTFHLSLKCDGSHTCTIPDLFGSLYDSTIISLYF